MRLSKQWILLVVALLSWGCAEDEPTDGSQDVIDDSNATESCCPIDDSPSGCMNLGGARTSADSCSETCDFWCSTNWRVETRDGCEVWVYDTRSPEPGENAQCLPE